MTTDVFKNSASFIAKRNISQRVIRVIATFDQSARHLSVIYVLNGEPSENDREDCELTGSELIAEFPEILTAETSCISVADYSVEQHAGEGVVFHRDN